MARIGDDTLIVRAERRSDASWLFTIRYLVQFDQGELGNRFDDWVRVLHFCAATPVPFLACGRSVLRKKRVVVDDDALAGLTDGQGVYATVCLRPRGGAEALVRSARLRRVSDRLLCAQSFPAP